MRHEHTIRAELTNVGAEIQMAEAAIAECCPECSEVLRPVLRMLDSRYDGLCAELVAVRRPFGAPLEAG